jgi:hypothetical protein
MKRALVSLALLLICGVARAQAPSSSTQPSTDQQPGAPGQQPTPGTPASGAQPAPGTPQLPAYTSQDQNPEEQTGPLPLSQEPHHRLLLQNDFVHVYNVSIPPLDATQLYQHDLPYIYVNLEATEITKAVAGQPAVHLTLQDGETHYSAGHFAVVLRTDSGLPLHDITLELPRTQGTARNLCKDVLPGQPTDCPRESASAGKKSASEAGDDVVPYFETSEVRIDLCKISGGRDYVEPAPKTGALLLGMTNANLDANLGGEHVQFLHGGDVLWFPAGVHRKVVDFLGTHSSFLLISFKDSGVSITSP